MKSDGVKIAEIESRNVAMRELGLLLRHPAISVVTAFVIVEALQKVYVGPNHDEPLMGNIVGTMLEGGLIAAPMLDAIGKTVATVAPAIASIAGKAAVAA